MGFKQIIERLTGGNNDKKELLKQMETQMRVQQMLEDRQKSANLRELERFEKEENEEYIKQKLDYYRKKKDLDIRYGHNPLNVPNITSKTEWEVLKEKNQFSDGRPTIFKGDGNVMKNNNKLLRNNRSLYGI